MKKFILGVLLVTSFPSFAVIGLNDCKSLLGEYTCTINGDTLDLSVKKTAANTVKIGIADENSGDSGSYIVDGVTRKSSTDDSQVKASCREGGSQIEVLTMFKDQLEVLSVTTVNPTTVKYSIEKPASSFSFNCTKK
ncbi:hypothetical protein SHI21_11720 [Bacteriovorax sp. PP10]|uniref:Uncharacterized protein n=1 Tax=Bacteriovorax antarcticus TaxID=3088717 RepID=A0ABU5VVA2_9BACT|nr:hypothetical protein [Bacteriovorax sp. PP10]MEA9356881.1 hypothetical protein [Bacteriovorax sp. PP10]